MRRFARASNNVDQAVENRKGAMDPKDLKQLVADANSWKAQLDPIRNRLTETITEIQSIEDNLTEEKHRRVNNGVRRMDAKISWNDAGNCIVASPIQATERLSGQTDST